MAIISDLNAVTANMGSKDGVDGATVSRVVDLHRVVPASRHNHIRVLLVELYAENSIRMPTLLISLLHLECKLLGRLIINMNVQVAASQRQQGAILIEVHSVDVVLRVRLNLVEQFSARSVPVAKRAIG